MSYITFKSLQDKYLYDSKNKCFNYNGTSNYPFKDKCTKCYKVFEYKKLKKFLRNRLSLPITEWCQCHRCFLKFRTILNPQWIEDNRKAQLIAQNKPEQKKKNAIGVSKSWDSKRKKKASILLKNRWKTDKVFAQKATKNLKINNQEHIKNTFGIGGLKGYYKNIFYDSALELSYILWCEQKFIPIKRYDLDPIPYKVSGKYKLYFPDFIINKSIIVEIKGKGLYFTKNKKQNLAKTKQAKKILGDNFKIIFDKDKEVKTNYRKARKLHYEIKEKNNN